MPDSDPSDSNGTDQVVDEMEALKTRLDQVSQEHKDKVAKLTKLLNMKQKEVKSLQSTQERLSKEKISIASQIMTLKQEVIDLNSQIERLVERLAKALKPPYLFGYFLRFYGDDKADIMSGNAFRRVSISPDVDRDSLKLGMQVVLLEDTSTLIDVYPKPLTSGQRCKFIDFHGEEEATIEGEQGVCLVVYVSCFIDRKQLTEGAYVLAREGFIWEVLETAESLKAQQQYAGVSDYFLLEVPDVTFEDIGGLEDVLQEIEDDIKDPYDHPDLFEAYHKSTHAHRLLYGLPGNGKTMVAKAIARVAFDRFKDRILKVAPGNFVIINGPELESKWVGVAEKALRDIFGSLISLAKAADAPFFLFFDDCEAFLKARGMGISSDVNMSYVTQFTSCLQGMVPIRGLNVILATNRLDIIDSAVIRRMHRKYRIPPPTDRDSAGKILRLNIKKLPLHRKYSDLTAFPELKGDDERILDNVLSAVLNKIFDDDVYSDFMRVKFEDGDDKIIKIHELLSGQILVDIVERAKRIAINRDKLLAKDNRPSGQLVEDFTAAVDDVFISNEGLPSTAQMISEWYKQKGLDKTVLKTDPLFGRSKDEESKTDTGVI